MDKNMCMICVEHLESQLALTSTDDYQKLATVRSMTQPGGLLDIFEADDGLRTALFISAGVRPAPGRRTAEKQEQYEDDMAAAVDVCNTLVAKLREACC